jgi:MarR family transcriptional regulator, temperature-dependent positive regulator of motility
MTCSPRRAMFAPVAPADGRERPGLWACQTQQIERAMKRHAALATLDRLARSPIHLLHRAGQCAEDLFHAEIKDRDLTPRQLAVLVTVARTEGLSQTGLVARTGIDRSTLADIVRRMQKKGLLQRRRTKEDARAYAVRLTGEGRRALRAAEPVAKRVDARLLEALPVRQRGQFIDELTAIVAAFEKPPPEAR